ncbi:MAG TPA: hypothetical protein PLJ21_03645, partial [Pseudobdellovibrionaceae bacterium]|nr:hypothetical protein [Pseudobdellovibrionaceae bacterium]
MVEVPRGNDRLIQVFAAYSDSEELSDFLYGDVRRNLVNAEELVDVSLETIATGISMQGGGRVAGRYLETESMGPTGELYVQYAPTGKPSMIIEKSQMVAGWFQAMALENLKFDYVLSSGQNIIPQFSFSNATIGTKLLSVKFPSTFERSEYGAGNVQTWKTENGSDVYLGYFGPAVGSKSVCYSSIDYTFTDFAEAGSNGSNKLIFQEALSSSSPNAEVIVSGGQSCSGPAIPFEDVLAVDPLLFDGDGPHSVAGFLGGFKYLATANG